MIEGWKNFGPTALLCLCFLLITYIFLHVNIQTGEGGVEDGVIAKSLLHKTDKTPNPRMHIKWNHRKFLLNLIVFQWIKPKK